MGFSCWLRNGYPSTTVESRPGAPVTFTLSASGAPAGSLYTFTIDWFDGTTETVTGPGGTVVTHSYNNAGSWQITAAASYSGATSLPAYHYVSMWSIPVTVQADLADASKQILVVDSSGVSGNYGGAGLDWYCAHLKRVNVDQVNGQTSGEVVTSI
jgi:hypothetical protein